MAYSWDGACLEGISSSIHSLPLEVREILLRGSNHEFLDALAILALDPKWTADILVAYEPLMVDICNRWLSGSLQEATRLRVIFALASIMPFAPHLSPYTEEVVFHWKDHDAQIVPLQQDLPLKRLSEAQLSVYLLALTRLLEFGNLKYATVVCPSNVQQLLSHENASIRYLSIKLLCLYLHAGDKTFNDMMHRFIGNVEVLGQWDDRTIDYLFYPAWEVRRQKHIHDGLRRCRATNYEPSQSSQEVRVIKLDDFSKTTLTIANVLFPHVKEIAKKPLNLVMTDGTSRSIKAIVSSITSIEPTLVMGPPGSGKSSIIKEIARVLRQDSKMLTLHLNEQTDAKHLIGLHTTSGALGSFAWQPGVLTRAVQEGLWVLIEDIDHAPKDVMSLLLPLIERNELLVPNLGGYIQAARGFKLLATVRTSELTGQKVSHLGQELLETDSWHHVHLQSLMDSDIQKIISDKHPNLSGYQPMLMALFNSLNDIGSAFRSSRNRREYLKVTHGPVSLFRFCNRMETVLKEAGITSSNEPISESIYDHMFLEAVDSFASGIQSDQSRREVVELIAQHLQVSPARVRYCFTSRTPDFVDRNTSCSVGRVALPKRQVQASKTASESRPFVRTKYTLRCCESIAAAVRMREPCLLVGETGTGKTTLVQALASFLGYSLAVVNLSQQSEASDLLGGFKPLNIRAVAVPIKDDFELLFNETFPSPKNQRFLAALSQAIVRKEWSRLLKLFQGVLKHVDDALESRKMKQQINTDVEPPKKKKKTLHKLEGLVEGWEALRQKLRVFENNIESGSKGFGFSFLEGNIVKAVREGNWVLLDEINLASPDVLESLSDLLSNDTDDSFLLLSETGTLEKIKAHHNFRIFGAMNPASDVGKKDLPPAIRSRFTELYVESPDKDLESLIQIIDSYLGSLLYSDKRAGQDVGNLFLDIKTLEKDNRLVDGAGQKPHFSLRTLTRTLVYVKDVAPTYGLRRALFEGFSMSFVTVLNAESKHTVLPFLESRLFRQRDSKALRFQIPRVPNESGSYVQFKHHWICKGPLEVLSQPDYILTPFVEENLLNLVRATSTRRYPILLQGPTSSGKTSMVKYLAGLSGNKCVRINNHEHTDLQEYLGTYMSEASGRILYREGVLVRALREGHWIVLDELNLASSDILEALNRLLDDNRELLIPETQEIVRPHEDFMLFATQNPPGMYGGRKVLSRAFRNRFLEIHFSEIPEQELETILRERAQIAPSFCSKIVSVYKRLAILRQSERLFEQEQSFATLRDLFRWANRKAESREELAVHGFMILGERVRKPEERLAVKRVIEEVTKTKVDEDRLYEIAVSLQAENAFVWTKSMRRLFVLITEALRRDEPVLLVGETGTGKTAVCQAIARSMSATLHILNAHQNTETGDLVGAQRPVRNRSQLNKAIHEDLERVFGQTLPDNQVVSQHSSLLDAYRSLSQIELDMIPTETRHRIDERILRTNALFEWSDSNLVQAMLNGEHFLLDEISLADDAVLERLNSILEPSRTLLLAEKGGGPAVTACQGFQFLATMNPPGDYGKRELSPALRNRFTEIWVPSLTVSHEVKKIVEMKLTPAATKFAEPMVAFSSWFSEKYNGSSFSLRQILTWVEFINFSTFSDPYLSIVHGAAMVFIDSLGANPAGKLSNIQSSLAIERQRCLSKLSQLFIRDLEKLYFEKGVLTVGKESIRIGPFQLTRHTHLCQNTKLNLDAPTTLANCLRIARAVHLGKPVLIEGNPGVGKTTLVAALAEIVGAPLTRINLSEQTDLMDLFGSDVPAEDGNAGQFVWRDAPFLQAMQRGEWVLLDEMNLASQAVLEGLNACLDHRGQVYIPELDQEFSRHPSFMVFAAQNPHVQGNGRKGLPASFVNRFTVVYADLLTDEDLRSICMHLSPTQPESIIESLIESMSELNGQVEKQQKILGDAGYVDFNLRDLLRWLQLLAIEAPTPIRGDAVDFLDLLFFHRLRADQKLVGDLRVKVLQSLKLQQHTHHDYFINLNPSTFQVGHALVAREHNPFQSIPDTARLGNEPSSHDLALLESLMFGVQHKWPCLLVGQRGSGNLSALRRLAHQTGYFLMELPMNSDMDVMDLIGGYEQTDFLRKILHFMDKVGNTARQLVTEFLSKPLDVRHILPNMAIFEHCSLSKSKNLASLRTLLVEVNKVPVLGTVYRCLLDECIYLLTEESKIGQAHFEWVDGILVRALQEGHWLVLRDANLCSSSVLDRLNALMEPSGTLEITEHRLPDGGYRVVQPHDNFRIFLTMDPKYGELSRAMRNRCVELFFPSREIVSTSFFSTIPESSLIRYAIFQNINWNTVDAALNRDVLFICLDHLCFSDLKVYQRYCKQIESGLLDLDLPRVSMFQDACDLFAQALCQNGPIFSTISKLYQDLITQSPMSEEFVDSQPIHPLNNAPFTLSTSTRLEGFVFWTAGLLDVALDLACLRHDINKWTRSANSDTRACTLLRASSLQTIDSVTESLTHLLISFIGQVGDGIQDWLGSSAFVNLIDLEPVSQVQDAMRFLDDIFYELVCNAMDESTLQVYLEIGGSVASKCQAAPPCTRLGNVLASALQNLESPSMLSTGLSMYKLWQQFRPSVAVSQSQLTSILNLESVANRFDSAVARIDTMSTVIYDLRHSLREAMAQLMNMKEVNESSIEGLIRPLEIIECETTHLCATGQCHFTQVFEGLCQATWSSDELAMPNLALLEAFAQRHTLNGYDLSQRVTGAHMLSQIFQSTGIGQSGTELLLQRNAISVLLLGDFESMSSVPLQRFGHLQQELDLLRKSVGGLCLALNTDPFGQLLRLLGNLHQRVLASHQDLMNPSSFASCLEYLEEYPNNVWNGAHDLPHLEFRASDKSSFGANKSRQLQKAFGDCFCPSLAILHSAASESPINRTACAQAWITFCTGCLWLYLPNRVHDPAKREVVFQRRFEQKQRRLQMRLDALRIFDQACSTNGSSIRYHLAKKMLVELGDIPEVDHVFRPEISEMSELQSEFSSILISIVGSAKRLIGPAASDKTKPLKRNEILLIRKSIQHSIARLCNNYRAYDDLSGPIVGLLRGLDVGLALTLLQDSRDDYRQNTTDSILQLTPLLGLTPSSVARSDFSNIRAHLGRAQDNRPQYLRLASLVLSIHREESNDLESTVTDVFHSYYNQWKRQLQLDKDAHTVRTSLYQYRGMQDANEINDPEDYPELFPELDVPQAFGATAEHATSVSTTVSPQELAALHRGLFLHKNKPSELMLSMIQQSSDAIATLWKNLDAFTLVPVIAEDVLSGVVLGLDRASKEVTAQPLKSPTYNFYTESNVHEVQKLAQLVRRIQLKFRDIQSAWPEHATLAEVLKASTELLNFSCSEPMAKILTKAEQLHSFIHEWQTVAGREYTAVVVYDDLTALLVSWRQLELSTWAGLLESEDVKCRNDAQSWWFLAYEVTIAAPLEVLGSDNDLKVHVQELAKSLIEFLTSTPLGQFQERLEILERFRDNVHFLVNEHPSMTQVRTALTNILRYYKRYVPSIQEVLVKGRSDLEKDVKEIILLATWKDTNITALRESSRRSRTKLLKVIRKYRALLTQPVNSLLGRGLPEINKIVCNFRLVSSSRSIPLLPKALQICATNLINWVHKPARFIQVHATAQQIARMGTPLATAIDADSYIYSFIASLAESANALRRETPPAATDENKAFVKHLKSRKRRLLADTLQTVRLMGLKLNPGSQLLGRQASLHSILANSPSLSSSMFDTEFSEHCFDRSLDNISAIRGTVVSHNEDLTSKEASRCLGYLEGILSTVLDQRQLLAHSLHSITKLDYTLEFMSGLWKSDFDQLQRNENKAVSSQLRCQIRWLEHLIEAACVIIRKQDHMKMTGAPSTADALDHWRGIFQSLAISADQFVCLPKGLATTYQIDFESQMSESLSDFSSFAEKEELIHPTMRYILKKLRLWSSPLAASPTAVKDTSQLEPSLLDENLANLIDSVLANVQQVQEALAKYPTSLDQSNWLAQTHATVSNALRCLRTEAIARSCESLLDMIQFASDTGSSKVKLAAAMCTVSAPIFYQFLDTAKDLARRHLILHQACCSMLCSLSTICKQIATDGFCGPREKAQNSEGMAEKFEDGTGLGEGEGVEDISKDVEEDEDLSELAAQKATKEDERDEVQAQDDAVDMDHDELEGEMGDDSKDESHDDQDHGNDDAEIDEEIGRVDDLDPAAVDEKLWDEAASATGKEKETDKHGGEKKDDLTARNGVGDAEEDLSRSDGEEDAGAEEDEQVKHQESEALDPHPDIEDHLVLPDEMEIDGKDKPLTDSDTDFTDALSDAQQSEADLQDGEVRKEDVEMSETSQAGDDDTNQHGVDDANLSDEVSEGGKEKDVEDDLARKLQTDGEPLYQGDALPSGSRGGVEGFDEPDVSDEGKGRGTNDQAKEDMALENSDEVEDSAQVGQKGHGKGQVHHDGHKSGADDTEDPLDRAFKKLGDAFEKWRRQNSQLQTPQESEQDRGMDMDVEPVTELFEHLPGETAASNAQALGAATEEEAHALDEKAMEAEISCDQNDFLPNKASPSERDDPNNQMEGIDGLQSNGNETSPILKPALTFINGYQSNASQDPPLKETEDESDVSYLDTNLSTVHLNPSDSSNPRSNADARQLWTRYEAQTRELSLVLTEQLRLILAPTLATKMRGDFRTGKRLNIKRIIPYIASGYKRDKIWMRRSVPSKRSYQIMLAVDDSKSMGSSGSGALAFETLALVSKSLSMLEVGQICIVGFGDEVRVAHQFEHTFSSDAGANVLQQFGFQQTKTNVKSLMVESIKLFREARARALSSAVDLWQLELIISDGVCEDHEGIRRLVRQAHEERIMVVFVIVDGVKGESIMDMTRAEFEDDGGEGGSKVKIRRYLEGFPFGCYLIVGDVKELPGVLATALRQWFAEVAESS